MKVLVTGSTGFIGAHAVTQLLAAGHHVFAVTRNAENVAAMPWRDSVTVIQCDIHSDDIGSALANAPDMLVHLAWAGLPNYQAAFHFEQNLPADYRFLKHVVKAGIRQILVTGTGAEFGLQAGALDEDALTSPVNAYGIAKDSLRRFLQHLQLSCKFNLQWVRLFHLHGPGQNSGSLLAQLDKAIDEGATSFNMSGGEQIRDYLPVQEVARRIALLVLRPEINGIINCGSGNPITVRQLVESRIAERQASLALNLGVYPYPDYEPVAYWGKVGKLKAALEDHV